MCGRSARAEKDWVTEECLGADIMQLLEPVKGSDMFEKRVTSWEGMLIT